MRPVRSAASRPNRAANPLGRNRAPTTVPRSLIIVRNTRSTTPCTSVFGSEKPWRGVATAPFMGDVQRRERDHRVGERLPTSQVPAHRPEKPVRNDPRRPRPAHRSRSNNDVEPARPTTPRSGAASVSSCSCTHAIQVTKGAHSSGKPMPRRAACPIAKNWLRSSRRSRRAIWLRMTPSWVSPGGCLGAVSRTMCARAVSRGRGS